jgi:tetratricopeptide (TPR) repeat protein
VVGLQMGYNLDYAEALEAFEQAKAADPDDPVAYRLAAGTAWTALLFEQGAVTVDDYLGQARPNLPRHRPTAALDGAFRDNLRQALTLAEQRRRDRDEEDADAHYQVGAAYAFLASYEATVEGRVLGSIGPARRAYREHQRVLELDPERKDAGLVVGLYRYAVADLSVPMRLLAHLAGFGGDREQGLRMVEEAAAYPSVVRPNALFMLVLLYNRERRHDDAMRVIKELQHEYPKNRLLWLEAGTTALRARRPEDAREALEEGLRRLRRDTRPRALGEEARWHYAYGAALVALKDVASAERELRVALTGAPRDWIRGRIHQELGKLADLADDRPRALDEYRLSDRLCRDDRDSECLKEVKTLMRTRYQ